jgi:DinB superfamily
MTDVQIPNAAACLQILEQTPGLLRNLLATATLEQLDWRPSAERWSIAMVLAHLADVEVAGFRSRFEAMLGQDQPLLPSYDQLALFRSSADFDPYAEMARFEERRDRTIALLQALPDGTGERRGRHEDFGMITLTQLLNEFAFHDLGHIRQIMELYRSHVFYPEMGPCQGFYKINP